MERRTDCHGAVDGGEAGGNKDSGTRLETKEQEKEMVYITVPPNKAENTRRGKGKQRVQDTKEEKGTGKYKIKTSPWRSTSRNPR